MVWNISGIDDPACLTYKCFALENLLVNSIITGAISGTSSGNTSYDYDQSSIFKSDIEVRQKKFWLFYK